MDAPGSRRIRIVADIRERGSDLLRLLQDSRLVDLRISTLGTGDYIVEEQVTIERKTRSDFAIALVEGRLFQQAARLGKMSRPIVLVEGESKDPHAVHPRALQGAILSLSTAWRIPVVFSRDAAESAWIVEALGQQSLFSSPLQLARGGYRPKRLRNRQSFVLQGLPGVGPVLARRLLQRFGTVRAVMTAGAQELSRVPGCGSKRAAEITRVLGR